MPHKIEKPAGNLNHAQVAFLGLLSAVKSEEELAELKKIVARHLLLKIKTAAQGEAKRLGVDSEKGYETFARKNHLRTS